MKFFYILFELSKLFLLLIFCLLKKVFGLRAVVPWKILKSLWAKSQALARVTSSAHVTSAHLLTFFPRIPLNRQSSTSIRGSEFRTDSHKSHRNHEWGGVALNISCIKLSIFYEIIMVEKFESHHWISKSLPINNI